MESGLRDLAVVHVSEMERVAIVDSGLLSLMPISDSPSTREGDLL